MNTAYELHEYLKTERYFECKYTVQCLGFLSGKEDCCTPGSSGVYFDRNVSKLWTNLLPLFD
jgi:hypothetical protein